MWHSYNETTNRDGKSKVSAVFLYIKLIERVEIKVQSEE
jgi:hypothetical protein